MVLRPNENEERSYQISCSIAEAVLKFVRIQAYIKKGDKTQISGLMP